MHACNPSPEQIRGKDDLAVVLKKFMEKEMKILVAASSSENFDGVIDYLRKGTWTPNSEFKLLHVVEPSDVSDIWLSISGATRFRQILTERKDEAESHLAETEAKCLDVLGSEADLNTRLLVGPIDEVVVQASLDWNPDVVILGLPESSFFGRYTEGPMLTRVLADAPCPVIFARKQGNARQEKSA